MRREFVPRPRGPGQGATLKAGVDDWGAGREAALGPPGISALLPQPAIFFDCRTIKWYLPYSLWPRVNRTSISRR